MSTKNHKDSEKLLSILLSLKDWARAWRGVWAFVLLNVMAVATFILYPAAPPWYVEKYGLGPAVLNTSPSVAGAARIDQLLGIDSLS